MLGGQGMRYEASTTQVYMTEQPQTKLNDMLHHRCEENHPVCDARFGINGANRCRFKSEPGRAVLGNRTYANVMVCTRFFTQKVSKEWIDRS